MVSFLPNSGVVMFSKEIWATTCDFQRCGILTSVDSDEAMQPPFKLRNSKWSSESSLTVIEYSSDKQWLWSDCVCAGWSEALLVAQTKLLEIKCHGSLCLRRPPDKGVFFSFHNFQQKYMSWVLKGTLSMIRLFLAPWICSDRWIRKWSWTYAQNYCLSGPMIHSWGVYHCSRPEWSQLGSILLFKARMITAGEFTNGQGQTKDTLSPIT